MCFVFLVYGLMELLCPYSEYLRSVCELLFLCSILYSPVGTGYFCLLLASAWGVSFPWGNTLDPGEATGNNRKAEIFCFPPEERWRVWFPGVLPGCRSALGAPQSCHREWAAGDADTVGGVDVPSNPPPNALEVLLLSFSAIICLQHNSTPSKYIKINTGSNILGVKIT